MKPEIIGIAIGFACVVATLIGLLLGKIMYNSQLEDVKEKHKNQVEKLREQVNERNSTYESTIKEFQRKNVELNDKVKLLEVNLAEKEKKILELERDASKELTADLIKTVIENIKK